MEDHLPASGRLALLHCLHIIGTEKAFTFPQRCERVLDYLLLQYKSSPLPQEVYHLYYACLSISQDARAEGPFPVLTIGTPPPSWDDRPPTPISEPAVFLQRQ